MQFLRNLNLSENCCLSLLGLEGLNNGDKEYISTLPILLRLWPKPFEVTIQIEAYYAEMWF